MSFDEPKDSSWQAWFWLAVIILILIGLSGAAGFFVYAIWKGIS